MFGFFITVIVSIILFAIVYATLPDRSFEVNDRKGKLTPAQALFVSLNSQTLLGNSGVEPISDSARLLVVVQASITLVGFIFVTFQAAQMFSSNQRSPKGKKSLADV